MKSSTLDEAVKTLSIFGSHDDIFEMNAKPGKKTVLAQKEF